MVNSASGLHVWWCCKDCQCIWNARIIKRGRGIETGCLRCKSSKGVKSITKFLTNNNIQFDTEVSFEDCRNVRKLLFDVRIIVGDSIFLIEFDGVQHFEEVKFHSTADPVKDFTVGKKGILSRTIGA